LAKINPIKIKQDADREEKAGRLDRAIALYRQLLDDNPKDWNTINKIGDLFARMSRVKEASDEYAKVADFYAKDGFHLKAIAIWKKINKLDATVLEPYLQLADLYAKQGLMMEAKAQYQIVVDEYLKRGRSREAGDVLRKMADIDPADLKIRSRLADIYLREGKTAQAVEEHVAIAEELNRKGHPAEALQVLEKGLKLDPGNARLRAELARAYVVQKNFGKAAEFLEDVLRAAPDDAAMLAQLGEAYLSNNRLDDADKVFSRLAGLNPEDLETKAQLARLKLARGDYDAACDALTPVVDRLAEQGKGDKALGLLQQVLQKNPSHVKTLIKLVELQRVLRNDRGIAAAYSQLSEAYIKGGELDRAASVLEILVSLEPQNQQYASKLQFVRNKMGGPQAPDLPPLEEEGFAVPFEEPALDVEVKAPEMMAAPTSFVVPQEIEASGPLSEEDKEFIEEHLAEGKVFRKYGLIDKAADQFEAVIARFPDHLETRQELLDVYKEKGQLTKAAQQCVALAQIYRLQGDLEAAEAAVTEAKGLAPEVVPEGLLQGPAAEPMPLEEEAALEAEALPIAEEGPAGELGLGLEAEAAAGGDGLPAIEEELPLAAEEELPLAAEEEIPLAAEEEVPLPAGGEEEIPLGAEAEEEIPLAGAGDELPVAPEAEEELPLDLEAAAEPPLAEPELGLEGAVPEPSLDASAELGLAGAEPAAAAGEDLGFPGDELPGLPGLEAPPPPEPVPAPVAAPAPLRAAPKAVAPAPAVPVEIQKVLAEVDSYMSLGFVDDARDALREVAARFPGHAGLAEKMAELGLGAEPSEEPVAAEPEAPAPPPMEAPSLEEALGGLSVPEPSVVEPPPVSEGGIDLGAELSELFSAQSAVEEAPQESVSQELGDAGLTEIFKEFKKGVDKQLGKEDYDTRYNLGIAYKEMGLIDEAIAEFQLAAKDEARLLECSSMLGICFMEKGMAKLAIKWFEKGLEAPGRRDEEYQGLRYDLAMAYEADGERRKALELFTDLYGQDANFRDVSAKVRELRAVLG
jgi:tetratricopeptide (TPR) repeat protein